MKRNVFIGIIIGIVFFLVSCSNKEKSNERAIINPDVQVVSSEMVLQTCYVCHNPSSESHDDLIAPPLAGVKRHYLMQYPEKEEFVKAVVQWVRNPDEKTALMRGAVANFKLMPAQPFDESVLTEVATFIYENEVDKPGWFDAHYQEMHGNGGMGGMGRGNQQGRGNQKGSSPAPSN